MVYTTVATAKFRQVELGRVVLITSGENKGKLAAVVEIIDRKRVLVEGPKTNVPRQGIYLSKLVLTNLVIPNIAQGMKSTALTKKWEAADICNKWAQTAWAKKIAQRETRKSLSDFERFQALVYKKQRRYALNKAVAKA